MARQSSTNYAGLRSALVLGSVAASVLGGRLLTQKDAAAQAQADALAQQDLAAEATDAPTQAPTAMLPQPTPTPKIIIIYDLPPVAGSNPAAPASSPVLQAAPQLPQQPVVTGGGGGGGGGGGQKPPPVKKTKPSKK